MAEECTWDPSKHNGQACPKHGNGGKSGGYSTSIKGGKWKLKRDNADEEDISEEEYNELKGNEKFDDDNDEEFDDENFYNTSYYKRVLNQMNLTVDRYLDEKGDYNFSNYREFKKQIMKDYGEEIKGKELEFEPTIRKLWEDYKEFNDEEEFDNDNFYNTSYYKRVLNQMNLTVDRYLDEKGDYNFSNYREFKKQIMKDYGEEIKGKELEFEPTIRRLWEDYQEFNDSSYNED